MRLTDSLRLVPMLAVMAVIFLLSHQSGDQFYQQPFPYFDKLVHVGLYAVLAATAIYAFSGANNGGRPVLKAAAVVILCGLYGASDEWHQSFIAGREVSGGDWLADIGGSVAVALMWLRWRAGKRG